MSSDSGPKILIVDDDPDMLLLLSTYFRDAGANVTGLEKPEAALEVFKSADSSGDPFSMVIVDIRMPIMNGNQLTMAIRETGSLDHFDPYLLLTRAIR